MRFLRHKSGTAALEWLVVAIIVVAVLGTILWNIFQQLASRYADVAKGL